MFPYSEWMLLILLAVILLKPEDIPLVFKFIAKLARQAKQIWSVLELDKISDDLESDFARTTINQKHPFNCAPPRARVALVKD